MSVYMGLLVVSLFGSSIILKVFLKHNSKHFANSIKAEFQRKIIARERMQAGDLKQFNQILVDITWL